MIMATLTMSWDFNISYSFKMLRKSSKPEQYLIRKFKSKIKSVQDGCVSKMWLLSKTEERREGYRHEGVFHGNQSAHTRIKAG